MGFWLAKFVFLGPLLRLIWRPWIEGAENIPDDRPAILASNHLSFSDSFFMPLMLPRRVTFLAKAEYFTTPGLKGWFPDVLLRRGQVPIDRGDRDARGRAAHRRADPAVGHNLLGIYPEGTRSPDGRLYRGKTGVARLALESGAGDPVRDDRHRRSSSRPGGASPSSPASRRGSASRWTSPATRAWTTTASSCGR